MTTVEKRTKRAGTPAVAKKRAQRAATRPQRLADRRAKQLSPERTTLTPHESTRITGFGVAATYAMLREGRLPCIKVGMRYYLPKNSLLRWMEEEASRELVRATA